MTHHYLPVNRKVDIIYLNRMFLNNFYHHFIMINQMKYIYDYITSLHFSKDIIHIDRWFKCITPRLITELLTFVNT